MLSESFKIVYFAGVLASLLSISTAKCPLSDPACDYKVEGGHLSQPPNYKIENIPNSIASAGKSLYWDHQTNNFYYVDKKAGQILRYDYGEEKVYKAKVKGEMFPGFIIPVEGKPNQFVVGYRLRVLIVEWDGFSDIATPFDTLFEVGGLQNRNNSDPFIYGKCDGRGRLFAGTFKKNFVYDNKKPSFSSEYERFSRTVVWDDRRKKIYYIDAHDFNIKGYSYDFKTGITDFSHQKIVMNFYKTNSSKKYIIPYDMTIDRDGNLYVAVFNDDRIFVINPEKDKLLYTIKLPCARITSVVFGGPNLDILYVATLKGRSYLSPCGSLFNITGLGSYGITLNKAVIPIKPNYKIKNIPNSSTLWGQSPYWDHQTNNLYYVDMNAGKILRYNNSEKTVFKAKVEGEVYAGFIIPVEDKPNQFVVGCGLRVCIVEWDGYSDKAIPLYTLFTAKSNDSVLLDRFIYGKCDARGRLLAGTITYNFIRSTEQSFAKRNTGLSKGLVWNDQSNRIYITDTLGFQIKEYPYDLKTGITDFRHEKVVMNFRRTNSSDHIIPYDMTIDRDGNLYVATVDDGRIYVINPDMNKLLYTIKLPCAHVTSAVFGGPNLDILYVTTSKERGSPLLCGSVFQITDLGSHGYILSKSK